MTRRIWLIAGPTASGKSALALRLARETGAEILGADALQLYRDIPILSAAPSEAERAQVPHHLIGVADAADGWSVGRWQRAARKVLEKLDGPAVIVGGTGLYFKALTDGLAEIPAIPDEVREQIEPLDEVVLRRALTDCDPQAESRIFPGDLQRLRRAYEVFVATGKSLTDWQAEAAGALPEKSYSAVTLAPPRDALYARCDARLKAMLDQGVLAEVEALMGRNLSPALPAMKAVGYREFAAHIRGDLSLDEALAAAQMETRRYAKRQMTWMRGQMAGWGRIETLDPEAQWRQFLALHPGLTP
jgi:tRNA dimethylallyltransferase